jgi:hypothetical protein
VLFSILDEFDCHQGKRVFFPNALRALATELQQLLSEKN